MLDSKIGQDMLAKFPSRGIIALAWGEQGFRHLTNNVRPVKTPADAKGLKIRTTENPIHIAAFRQIGILPTPMAWPEVATALQQGTIDGQENPLSVITSAKLSQMQKHLALTGHVYGPALVLMSANVYEGLSAADKANFDKAGKESAQAMRAYVDNIEKTGVEQLKKEGMQVTEVDRAAFAAAVEPAYPEYYKKYDKKLIDAIRDTSKHRRAGATGAGRAGGQRPPVPPAPSAGLPWFAPIASGTPFIMRLLCAFDRLLFKLVSVIAQLLLVAAAAAAFYQVIARFVLHAPADWSEVLTRALLIWTVLLGVALAFRHGAMISVELLRNLLGGARRRALEALIGLICAGFLGFVAWIGGHDLARAFPERAQPGHLDLLDLPGHPGRRHAGRHRRAGPLVRRRRSRGPCATTRRADPFATNPSRSRHVPIDDCLDADFLLSVPVAVSIGLASLAGSAPPTCPGWWWPSSYTPRWTSTRWWRFPSSWPAT